MKPTTEQLEAGALRDYWSAYALGVCECAKVAAGAPNQRLASAAVLRLVTEAAERAEKYAALSNGADRDG